MSMPPWPDAAYPSPYPPAPAAKKRPGWVWFLLGGLLMVVAVVVAAVTFGKLGLDIARDDAVFPASGTHTVVVPAHSERGLFVAEGTPVPQCDVADAAGAPLQFRSPDSHFTFNGWEAVRLFDTGDGTITFDCRAGQSGQIRIGQVPGDDDLARAGIVGVLVPLGVGGLGFLVVLVTGILWYTRRRPSAYAGPPPGWQPPPPTSWPPVGQPGPPPGQSDRPGQPAPSDQPPTWPPSP